jgi:hypothetical protein
MKLLLFISLIFLINLNVLYCDPASFNYVSPANTNLASWLNSYKSAARLETILPKCYECLIVDGDYASNTCSHTTGAIQISDFGVINVGGSFLNAQKELISLYNSITYNYPTYTADKVSSYANDQFHESIVCYVGDQDNAEPQACEYGHGYCQVQTYIDKGLKNYVYSCAAICEPSDFSICMTGALSNKMGAVCLIGDIKSGSAGAVPRMCDRGDICASNNSVGYCNNPKSGYPLMWGIGDYGNMYGVLCYVGEFGTNAVIKGCGVNDYCIAYRLPDNRILGACSTTSAAPSSAVILSSTKTEHFHNRQGPICFVGQFQDNAVMTACNVGQSCMRETKIQSYGIQLTRGSCSSTCVSSLTRFCCNTDLCNAYNNNEVKTTNYQPSGY